MASESSSDCQDEKAALVETTSEQDAGMQQLCAKQGESKLTLYHWTQSFNSQKVSGFTFQHHSVVDSSPHSSCNVSIATRKHLWCPPEKPISINVHSLTLEGIPRSALKPFCTCFSLHHVIVVVKTSVKTMRVTMFSVVDM